MAESSRKRKTQVGARRRRGPAVNEPEEIIEPSQPQRLFSSVAHEKGIKRPCPFTIC